MRSAGSYTPVRPSSASRVASSRIAMPSPGTSGSALPMPGMLKIMTPEDYAKELRLAAFTAATAGLRVARTAQLCRVRILSGAKLAVFSKACML